ncbi:MAG: hypothetical protein R6U10_05180 [Thermoplasmatota archaeon]
MDLAPLNRYMAMKARALETGMSEEEWIAEQEKWIAGYWRNLSIGERREIALLLARLRDVLGYRSRNHIDYDDYDVGSEHNQFIVDNLFWVMGRLLDDIRTTEWERKKMKEKHEEGRSIREIASMFNRSKRIVHQVLKKPAPP